MIINRTNAELATRLKHLRLTYFFFVAEMFVLYGFFFFFFFFSFVQSVLLFIFLVSGEESYF